MNTIKKIFLTTFLLLIVATNQTTFADITNHEDNATTDFSKKWQQIRNTKTGLETSSINLRIKYPKYASAISGILSHMNTLGYTGFIQPVLDMPEEQKEAHITSMIQQTDTMLKNLQTLPGSFANNAAMLPKEIQDFFSTTFNLMINTCELGKQELMTQLDKVKIKKNKNQNTETKRHATKYSKLLWTPDEQKELTDTLSTLENIKETINDRSDNFLKSLLQTGFSAAEIYIDLIKKSQKESYNLANLYQILEDIKSTTDAHHDTQKWLKQLQTSSPEIIEIMTKMQDIIFETDKLFKKIIARTIDELKPQDPKSDL